LKGNNGLPVSEWKSISIESAVRITSKRADVDEEDPPVELTLAEEIGAVGEVVRIFPMLLLEAIGALGEVASSGKLDITNGKI
jgi:hypothetical protein